VRLPQRIDVRRYRASGTGRLRGGWIHLYRSRTNGFRVNLAETCCSKNCGNALNILNGGTYLLKADSPSGTLTYNFGNRSAATAAASEAPSRLAFLTRLAADLSRGPMDLPCFPRSSARFGPP
jgi:hypothetical protein